MDFDEQEYLNVHNRLFGVIFFHVTANEEGS